jgi:Protein of unknown function (DUF4235)
MGVTMAAGAKIGMKAMSILIGIPVGLVTKKVVERTWIAARPDNPPRKTSQRDVRWGDAVGWAALSAAGIVVAELITQRGTQVAYRAITGNQPPPPKQSKDAKKLEKASEKARTTAD